MAEKKGVGSDQMSSGLDITRAKPHLVGEVSEKILERLNN